LGHKLRYFFTFFRVFRFEHTKISYLFFDYDLLEGDSLSKKTDINQNFSFVDEFKYNSVFLSLNLKFPLLASYLSLMPIILSLNFFLLHCLKSRYPRPITWCHLYLSSPYLFTGPLLLLTLFTLPWSVSLLLDLRYNLLTATGEAQRLSLATSLMLGCLVIGQVALVSGVVKRHWAGQARVERRFGYVFHGLKEGLEGWVASGWLPVVLMKRGAVAGIVVMMPRLTFGPQMFMVALQILMIAYLAYFDPFKQVLT